MTPCLFQQQCKLYITYDLIYEHFDCCMKALLWLDPSVALVKQQWNSWLASTSVITAICRPFQKLELSTQSAAVMALLTIFSCAVVEGLLIPVLNSLECGRLLTTPWNSRGENLRLFGRFCFPLFPPLTSSCENHWLWCVVREGHGAVHTSEGTLLIGGWDDSSKRSTEIAGGPKKFTLQRDFR